MMAKLRRVHTQMPGITRRRRGRGSSYEDPRGRPVSDSQTLERIRSLAIPPAWTDVWICPFPDGHLQALGTDAAGRRQYLYHEAWRSRRDVEKFHRVERFAEALPGLRRTCRTKLRARGMPKDKALALAVSLLDIGSFRVGSESYARDNGTFGLATIRRAHVRVKGSRVTFDFTAKSGKRRVQTIVDARLARIVGALKDREGGQRELLAYQEEGRWHDIRSTDINEYLHATIGDGATAKDFRTWQATVLAATLLAGAELDSVSVTSRRRAVTAVVKEVSQYLGNTPAVCRASYIDPRIVDRFLEGTTIASAMRGVDVNASMELRVRERIERAVLALLQDGSRVVAA